MTRLLRETGETRVVVGVAPGTGVADVRVEERFLRHMLETLARYSGLDLEIEAEGDLEHHVVEDVAITLGAALRQTLPESCRRYAEATVPMDEALVQAVLDAGGRSYWQGPLPDAMYDHFFRSLAENARFTIHVRVLRGEERHHVVEAAFKALGLALRGAWAEGDTVFSTKGSVRWQRTGGDEEDPC
jgi:imidazoleglycerol-phosphate dehydratase